MKSLRKENAVRAWVLWNHRDSVYGGTGQAQMDQDRRPGRLSSALENKQTSWQKETLLLPLAAWSSEHLSVTRQSLLVLD